MPQTAAQKAWYEANREAIASRAKERRLAYPEKDREIQRRKRLKRNYGLSETQYDELLREQSGVCAACGGSPSAGRNFDVDHDHATGAVRGILCHCCNVSIGYAKDDPATLDKLAAYLRQHKE